MDLQTPHSKYLRLANALVPFKNKRVIEVGGCSPVGLINEYGPASWTCIDLNERSVSIFNAEARNLGAERLTARFQDVTQFNAEAECDLIYSINSFEHIQQLEVAIENIYRALRPSGHLFTLFGPIWSSDVGHHLSVTCEGGGSLHFNDGVLDPWEHLTSTPELLLAKLEKNYGKRTAEKAVTYIFDYHDLNRLYEHDYLRIFGNSSFSKVLLLRKRHGVAPTVHGATNTRELLVLLKKGKVSISEKLVTITRLAKTYIAIRFGHHLVKR